MLRGFGVLVACADGVPLGAAGAIWDGRNLVLDLVEAAGESIAGKRYVDRRDRERVRSWEGRRRLAWLKAGLCHPEYIVLGTSHMGSACKPGMKKPFTTGLAQEVRYLK